MIRAIQVLAITYSKITVFSLRSWFCKAVAWQSINGWVAPTPRGSHETVEFDKNNAAVQHRKWSTVLANVHTKIVQSGWVGVIDPQVSNRNL